MNSSNHEFVSQTGRALLSLREMLLRGDFAPGERLSELSLVARLGVSRTPVRHALERLSQEGLLSGIPTGGYVVRSFTLSEVWDAIEIRGVLEGTAARLAAERHGESSELFRLRACRDEMAQILRPDIESFARYLDLNETFHSELVLLARSPMLARTLDRLLALPFASPSALIFARQKLPKAADLLTIGNEHHHAIVEAIEQRQGTRAEVIAREHALLSRRNLETALADREILSCVPGYSLIQLPA